VSSQIQNAVSIATSNQQLAEQEFTGAIQTAASTLSNGFAQIGPALSTAFTDPHVEAGMAYSLDGLLILGGVALCATTVVDGPAGDVAGASLIGAGVAGIQYNAEHSNSDGSVSGSFSWTTYGEELGIGAATGLISGGAGASTAAAAEAVGSTVGGAVITGAIGGATNGAVGQVLQNAVNGQALTSGVGESTAYGALAGGVVGGLTTYASEQASPYLAQLKAAISSGEGTESILPEYISAAGLKLAGKDLLGDAVKATISGFGGSSAIAADLGVTPSSLAGFLNMGSNSGSMTVTPQMFSSDLNGVFTASPSQAATGYVQSVTSVPLPYASGTALVGIGGDNSVYVNEQIAGVGSTGWVNLGGYVKSVAVTTGQDGLPEIFAIGADNAVYVNGQNGNGTWAGWTSLSEGGSIFKSIVATQSVGGTPEVFGIGFNNAAFTLSQNANGSWGSWAYLGGAVKQIAAVTEYGTTSLVALGFDNGLYVNQYSSGWTGWYNVAPGGAFKQIAAGLGQNGAEAYGLGFNNAVFTVSQSGGWGALAYLGGYAKSISTTPIKSTVDIIDANNRVEVDRYTFGGGDANIHGYWTGFQTLSTQGFTQVTAGLSQVYGLGADNHVYAINPGSTNTDVGDYTPTMTMDPGSFTFTIQPDHSVYVNAVDAYGNPYGYSLGGYVLSIASTRTENGLAQVFAVGGGGYIYANEQMPGGAWTGWTYIEGQVTNAQSLAAVKGPNGLPEAFVIGNDHALYVNQQNTDGSWTGFTSLGGQVSSISVAQDPSGGAAVAAIVLNGDAAFVNEQRSDGSFGGWAFTGGLVQSLTAVQAPDGGVALVAVGMDDAVWVDEQSFTASEIDFGFIDSSWTGFSSLGGNVTSVSATNNGFGSLEIFTEDVSGTQSTNTQKSGGIWSGFTVLNQSS
jgi:hypothetical protein